MSEKASISRTVAYLLTGSWKWIVDLWRSMMIWLSIAGIFVAFIAVAVTVAYALFSCCKTAVIWMETVIVFGLFVAGVIMTIQKLIRGWRSARKAALQ